MVRFDDFNGKAFFYFFLLLVMRFVGAAGSVPSCMVVCVYVAIIFIQFHWE